MVKFAGLRRWKALNLLIVCIKFIVLVLFALVSSYTLLCGKSGTGIKRDYVFFAIAVWIVEVGL